MVQNYFDSSKIVLDNIEGQGINDRKIKEWTKRFKHKLDVIFLEIWDK